METRRPIQAGSLLVALAATAFALIVTPHSDAQDRARVPGHDELPTVEAIIGPAVARAREQAESDIALQFESLVAGTVESLNEDGEVIETETQLYRRYPLEGTVYEELVERNGEPLDEDEAARERERREEFRRDAREAATREESVETNDERQVQFDEDLMARYRADLVGEESIDGEFCWVIRFEPREGDLPQETRMDRALNQSTGRLYIAQRDHGIVRIEFELLRPVRYLWGIIASLRTASGRLEFERVEPRVWMPERFDVRIELRVLFRTTRQRIVREWIDRRRIDAPAGSALPAPIQDEPVGRDRE